MGEQATVDQSITVQVNAPLSVVLHPAEGGGYWAEVPAFAGVVYADGETAEEATRNAEAMLADYFQRRERRQSESERQAPLTDAQRTIPTIPRRPDDLGIMMPLPPKVDAIRSAAWPRTIQAIGQIEDDNPSESIDQPLVFTREYQPRAANGVEPIAEEIAFYKDHLAEWAEHEGEYVLIKGSTLHGFFALRDAAVGEGYRRFGRVPMLVKQVLLNEKPRSLAWVIR